MAFQRVITCSNFVIISPTEYSFVSQQIAMSVRKRAGFLSPNRISELVWDSESEEAGASSDCIIYLGSRITCIFKQPLKYLCFSYSFLDAPRKYHVETLDSSRERHTGNDGASRYTGTALSKVRSVSVRDRDAAEMSRVNCEPSEENLLVKFW